MVNDDARLLDWEAFARDGFLRLGRVLDADALALLQNEIDAVMLGTADVPYDQMMLQLDSLTGAYGDIGPQSKGHKGATLAYRKIQDLERDPVFDTYLKRPLFRRICAHVYGPDTPIAVFRAMFMNKPAHQGTVLPWHQDRWNWLDRDPLVTVWTALDPATRANGCVQVVAGSHHGGLVNPDHPSGFVRDDQAAAILERHPVEALEMEAGEAVLLHNWLLHSSDVNRTDAPRRAFSVCYMDARTRSSGDHAYTRVF